MSKLKEQDFIEASKKLGCEVAVIKAVDYVESMGDGFLPNGSPKILFEGHVFWRELEKKGINPKIHVRGNEDVLYRSWTKQYYKGGVAEYDRLNKAIQIDKECALKSASWGRYQIMGNNHKLCGFNDVFDMFYAMGTNEKAHLDAFVNFVIKTRLDDELRDKRWADFARGYNGAMYYKNKYDVKLEKAYQRFK